MKNKKLLMTMLALILVCSISVAGTLAFLTASQNGNKTVVNTFLAAGDGDIIDNSDNTKVPDIDDTDEEGNEIELDNGFFLVESKVNFENGVYSLGTEKTLKNTYDKVVPAMTIPKDPAVSVNLAEGINAYVFVKIIDKTGGNITYSTTTSWSQITVDGIGNNAAVYVYAQNDSSIITGNTGFELDSVAILKGGENSTNATGQVVAINDFVDTDATNEGVQLGDGTLEFEAYACQATGFASAADAFRQCFVETTP